MWQTAPPARQSQPHQASPFRSSAFHSNGRFRCRPGIEGCIASLPHGKIVGRSRASSFDVRTSQRGRSLSLTVNSILVQEAGLSATEVDGRFVVLSLQAASYFDFNKVASEIWSLLSRPRRVDEILQELSPHHDVDIEVMTRDVMTFLQSLVAQNLVRIVTVEDAR